MRKIFLIFSVILFFTHEGFSQDPNRFGIIAGLTLPNVAVDVTGISTENKSKSGFIAGATLDLLSGKELTLFTELYYNRKNGESRYQNYFIEFRLDYLTYFAGGRYNFDGYGKGPYIFAGPRVDFYLSDKTTTNFFRDVNAVSENIKRVGAGMSAGFGTDVRLSRSLAIKIQLQFSPSFYDIYEEPGVSVRSNSFELVAGCKF